MVVVLGVGEVECVGVCVVDVIGGCVGSVVIDVVVNEKGLVMLGFFLGVNVFFCSG